MEDGLTARLGTRVDQNANFRLELASNGMEEPTVRINLLLILSFDDKNDLDGD